MSWRTGALRDEAARLVSREMEPGLTGHITTHHRNFRGKSWRGIRVITHGQADDRDGVRFFAHTGRRRKTG